MRHRNPKRRWGTPKERLKPGRGEHTDGGLLVRKTKALDGCHGEQRR